MITKIIKKIIFGMAVAVMLVGFGDVALAGPAPLVVNFNPNPLFNKPNFLPSDETSGIVTVTNNSDSQQTLLTEAINILDNDNFGSLLHLKISGAGGIIYDDSLHNFFVSGGEIVLGTVSSGQSAVYTYTISFINSDDNSYQGKTLGFDVCVGFRGGNTHCGDTVIGGEGNTGGGGGGGGGGIITGTGGGGGGGNGPITMTTLVIYNERANEIAGGESTLPTATALILWDTNLLSTSQVVYGPDTATYTFNVNNLPAFGYPSVTTEDTTKVLHHSILLTGLVLGQTYAYRVVSRASPPTVSFEHKFTVPTVADGGANTIMVDTAGTAAVSSVSAQSAGGAGGNAEGVINTYEAGATAGGSAPLVAEASWSLRKNLAAVFASDFDWVLSICYLIAILILLIMYLIWKFWLRKRYEKNSMPEEKIRIRFHSYFCLVSVLAIVISLIFGKYCMIPVFVVSLIICFCLYFYRKMT